MAAICTESCCTPDRAIQPTKAAAAIPAAADRAYQRSFSAVLRRCGASTVGSASSRAPILAHRSGPCTPRRASPIRWYPFNSPRNSASRLSCCGSWRACWSPNSPSIQADKFSFMALPPLVFGNVQQRPQLFGDRLARAENARAHGADGAIHYLRDVLVAHAFDLAQHYRRPQFLRQPIHALVHCLRDLLAHQQILRRVEVAQLIAVVKPFSLFRIVVGGGGRAPAHGHQVVLGGIDADPVQPGIEGAVATERRQCPVGFDECLLGHILDFAGIADEARQQTPEFALIFADQQFECMLVALLRTLDQLLVNIALTHAPPFPVVLRLFFVCVCLAQARCSIPQLLRRPRKCGARDEVQFKHFDRRWAAAGKFQSLPREFGTSWDETT